MTEQIDSNVPEIRFKEYSGSWEEKTFLEITEKIGSGKTPRGGSSSYVSSGIPLIRSQNITNNLVNLHNVVFISKEVDAEMANSQVSENDVLLNITGASIGRSAVYRFATKANVNQHVCIIRPTKNFNSTFIQLNLASTKGQKIIDSNQAGGAREGLNFQHIGNMSFEYPTVREQSKIGSYFQELDRMIGLHQRKHEKLVTLKQAMLQKMFPQDGATTPEIRFKGFSEPWEQRNLREITQPVSNNTLSRDQLNYKSGAAKNIHYGDILVRFGEVLDAARNDLPFVTNYEKSSDYKSLRLQDGDIIIADAAEDATVGKCTELFNTREDLVLAGLHTIALRPTITFASFYLGYFMNSHAFHNQLLPLMQGTKVLSVSKTSLKGTFLLFPTAIAEQQKIGTYFRKLDELISIHSIQLKKLKNIKSACLEKMFV